MIDLQATYRDFGVERIVEEQEDLAEAVVVRAELDFAIRAST